MFKRKSELQRKFDKVVARIRWLRFLLFINGLPPVRGVVILVHRLRGHVCVTITGPGVDDSFWALDLFTDAGRLYADLPDGGTRELPLAPDFIVTA